MNVPSDTGCGGVRAEHREVLAESPILSAQSELHLLETMLFESGGLRNRDLHLQRLAASADDLGFPFDLDRVEARVDARLLRAGEGARRVRLRLYRDGRTDVDL